MPGPPVETQPGIALAHEELAGYFHVCAVKRASAACASAWDAMTRTAALSSEGAPSLASNGCVPGLSKGWRLWRSPARRGHEAPILSSSGRSEGILAIFDIPFFLVFAAPFTPVLTVIIASVTCWLAQGGLSVVHYVAGQFAAPGGIRCDARRSLLGPLRESCRRTRG